MSPDSVQSEIPTVREACAVGVVVIGRNEGDRLRRCLESVRRQAEKVIYVDSGSIDGSLELSRSLGVPVTELDLSTPFTAARARNTGMAGLLRSHPELDYVFFVDGDCEVVPGWLQKASRFLGQHPDVAVVFGRRREQHPERSIYNLLCDLEWDTPIGETKACGGDAMIRVHAFELVQGYRPELICGEEPELCLRLRRAGWRIWRLDEEMTRHDAALLRFTQWWRRMLRGGYGFALGAALHGAEPERHWVVESRRAWFWGLIVPAAVAVSVAVFGLRGLVLLSIYPLQVVRLALRGQRSPRENWWQALATVVCKFPEAFGQIKFIVDQHRRVQSRLIEYK
jgi:glycosyltransferase involved in cell wall biosynthesis